MKRVFDDKWIFHQNGANAYRHDLTQERYRDNFPSFIEKDRWPQNSSSRFEFSV